MPDCPSCLILKYYLDCWKTDMKCPYCERIWRIPFDEGSGIQPTPPESYTGTE